jgi:hypothetical protein
LDGIFKLNAPFAKENFFPVTRTWPSGKEVLYPFIILLHPTDRNYFTLMIMNTNNMLSNNSTSHNKKKSVELPEKEKKRSRCSFELSI